MIRSRTLLKSCACGCPQGSLCEENNKGPGIDPRGTPQESNPPEEEAFQVQGYYFIICLFLSHQQSKPKETQFCNYINYKKEMW